MPHTLSTVLLYTLLGSFIIGWWGLAFHSSSIPPSPPLTHSPSLTLKTSTLLSELSPLQREELKRALAGDFPLMIHWIDHWHREAQFLDRQGIKQIQYLPANLYQQAHILGALIQESSPETLRQLNCKMNLEWIQDDQGALKRIEDHFQRFLPHSFIAASFLLAIAPHHEIIALHKGLRHCPQLYPPELFTRIPVTIDSLSREKLYLAHPDLAFVAPYSHPATLEVLRNQNIPLYTLKSGDTLKEIPEALLKVGHASNHILEAQLLAIFMEASFLAIDNRLNVLNTLIPPLQTPRRLLYLYDHQHYMLPTTKSLAGQLIKRALQYLPQISCPIPESQQEWRILFDYEKIRQVNPEYLILSSHDPYPQNSSCTPAYQQRLHPLEAFHLKGIVSVDETVQGSPTQYIVLAYFDLFQALAASCDL